MNEKINSNVLKNNCLAIKKMSLSKKICVQIACVLLFCMILSTVSVSVELMFIQNSQRDLLGNFFSKYNEFSLRETAIGVKKMILSVYDYRVCFINNLKNVIEKQKKSKDQQTILLNSTLKTNQAMCMLSNPNNSIFTCYQSTKFVRALQTEFSLQKRHPLKRVTIFYQNNKQQSDIKIITIIPEYGLANNVDFKVENYSFVSQSINSADEGESYFSKMSQDQYTNETAPVCYIRTKLVYENYTILFQVQTFANFLSVSLRKTLYSPSANIVVLWKNPQNPVGYDWFASLRPLDYKNINYQNLLQNGFRSFKMANGSVFQSYTLSFSNQYPLGIKAFISTYNINEDLSIIVQSFSISQQTQNDIYSFIDKMSAASRRFLSFNLTSVSIIIIGISSIAAYRIHGIIKIGSMSIRDYVNNLGSSSKRSQIQNKKSKTQRYLEILQKLFSYNPRQEFFHQILRNIYSTLQSIQQKKRRFKRSSFQLQYHHYPLNLNSISFQKKNSGNDLIRFQQIRNQLRKKQKQKKAYSLIDR